MRTRTALAATLVGLAAGGLALAMTVSQFGGIRKVSAATDHCSTIDSKIAASRPFFHPYN